MEGKAQSGAPVFADVRDVARAHILAADNPAASGRYIVANSHTTPAAHISAWLQVGAAEGGLHSYTHSTHTHRYVHCLLGWRISGSAAPAMWRPCCICHPFPTGKPMPGHSPLQERFPEYVFEAGEAGEPQPSINNSRVQRELGLAITPVRETLQDMAATLIALGLAQPQRKA